MPEKKVKILVADTVAFIKNAQMQVLNLNISLGLVTIVLISWIFFLNRKYLKWSTPSDRL